jgi:hypothetical protein
MRFKHLASPLSRLFNKASQDAAAPVDPTAALDSAPPQILLDIALGGGDETQRAAATGQLEDRESLAELAGIRAGAQSVVPASVERAAQQRLAQLVDAGTLDFGELRAAQGNVPALFAIAGYCKDPDRLPRLLATIDNPEHRAKLVLDGPSSRIRQLAAQSVSDPAELKRLLKQLRGKDKSVYKIIREKCDALNAEENRAAKTRSDAVGACESLERHSHRVHDVIYEATLRHFRARWDELEAQAEPEVRERAARAIARCEAIMNEHRERVAQQAAEASQRAARDAAREQAAHLAALESARLREAAARQAAEQASLREAEALARAEKSAAEALALREIGALIGKTQGALREGGTGRASGLRRALQDKLASVPLVPPPLARQVHQLDATLNELKDWKEHVAAPKRAALIEEMEALIGSALEPRGLADRIRQLQEDWKTVSKGVVSDSDSDWQRFHQAAQSAYQPCREHFEAEARLRQENLQQRRSILDRLRAFESAQSGQAVDWRAVMAVLKEAPEEWRRYFPVERAGAQASGGIRRRDRASPAAAHCVARSQCHREALAHSKSRAAPRARGWPRSGGIDQASASAVEGRGRRRARPGTELMGGISPALRRGLSKAGAVPRAIHGRPSGEQGASCGALRGSRAGRDAVRVRLEGRRVETGRLALCLRDPR